MTVIVRRNGSKGTFVPFYRPLSLLNEMDRLENKTWDSWRSFSLSDSQVPHTDIYEEEEQLVLKTELPGINKEDLDVTIEGDRLTIKAEKKEEVREDATHHTRERYYGQYFRTVALPYPIKENKINAAFDNGVLELRLPKAEEVKAKKIEINAQLTQGETKKRQQKNRQNKS
jgi:HSP20 family protein